MGRKKRGPVRIADGDPEDQRVRSNSLVASWPNAATSGNFRPVPWPRLAAEVGTREPARGAAAVPFRRLRQRNSDVLLNVMIMIASSPTCWQYWSARSSSSSSGAVSRPSFKRCMPQDPLRKMEIAFRHDVQGRSMRSDSTAAIRSAGAPRVRVGPEFRDGLRARREAPGARHGDSP